MPDVSKRQPAACGDSRAIYSCCQLSLVSYCCFAFFTVSCASFIFFFFVLFWPTIHTHTETTITVITSLLSVILEASASHPSVLISGVLGLVLAPYAAFQQRKITQVETLKETNEALQGEVAHLTAENDRLQSQVQQIETSVSNLSQLEETLDSVNALQGESIKKLEEQLNESKEILANMNRNRKAVILQNLITVLLATDGNQDMLLSDEEIDDLIHNMESINGVELKEDLVRQTIIDAGRSVAAVMEVARNVDSLFNWVEQ